MEVRRAVIRDLKRIQELNLMLFKKEKKEYDELLNLDWTFGKVGTRCFRKHLTKKDSCAFVVEEDGTIIGYLAGGIGEIENYRNALKSAELDSMFVLEEYRERGVGKMLYESFVKWCKREDVKLLRVEASAGNKEAIGFYRRMGFKDYSLILEGDIKGR
jgi:diamine N-acetyltransferase